MMVPIFPNSLNKGTAAIVEYPGVLSRPDAEQKIRKYIVDNNFIDTVIQLPENLFFGPTIATCIIVLKKNKADNNILFIDASSEFIKVGKKNKLTPDNIDNIIKIVKDRTNTKKSTLASYDAVVENDYNLLMTEILNSNMNFKKCAKSLLSR